MNYTKKLIALSALCLFSLLGVFVCTETALAQNDKAGKVDKSIATREGVGESLAPGGFDTKKMPGRMENILGFGSCAVMIIVIKWL